MKTISTAITEGIRVSVQPEYLVDHSRPALQRFVFGYRVKIENTSPYAFQLLRRRWMIVDGCGTTNKVEGEGVIGQQPVLNPGDSHEYNSWCPLITPLGKMSGSYQMMRLYDKSLLTVDIPDFKLIAHPVLN